MILDFSRANFIWEALAGALIAQHHENSRFFRPRLVTLPPPGREIVAPVIEAAERRKVRLVVVRRVLVEVRDVDEVVGEPAALAPTAGARENARAGDRAPAVAVGRHSGSIPKSAAK